MSSGLLIIGIVISFICFFDCINLYHLIASQKQDAKEYQYKEQIGGSYLNLGEEISLEDILRMDSGILRLQDVLLYRDASETPGLTQIIMSQQEPLIYPVLEGSIPKTDYEIENPTVILGRRQLEDAVYIDGQWYYELDGVMCHVCAVIGTEDSDFYDYEVLLYYQGLDAELKNRIDTMNELSFVIESNKDEVGEIFKQLQQRVQEKTSNIAIGTGSVNGDVNRIGVEQDTGYYMIILLFCIVNIIIVSEFWIKGRYKEIAVRKVFGYSDMKIYGLLYRDMVINATIAVGIAIIIQSVLQSVFKEYMQLYASQFGFYIIYSVLFIFAISGIIMVCPFFLLRKQDVMKRMILK
jgi:hypothetical protein